MTYDEVDKLVLKKIGIHTLEKLYTKNVFTRFTYIRTPLNAYNIDYEKKFEYYLDYLVYHTRYIINEYDSVFLKHGIVLNV